MELKEFVKNSLVSIIEGVSDAKKLLIENESSAVINATRNLGGYREVNKETKAERREIQLVEMDVAVSISEGVVKDNKGGLNIKVIEYGRSKGSEDVNSTTSRLKFSIPVVYSV